MNTAVDSIVAVSSIAVVEYTKPVIAVSSIAVVLSIVIAVRTIAVVLGVVIAVRSIAINSIIAVCSIAIGLSIAVLGSINYLPRKDGSLQSKGRRHGLNVIGDPTRDV